MLDAAEVIMVSTETETETEREEIQRGEEKER